MAYARLAPGEHSEIEAVPYRRDENNKRVKAANVRQATMWRARCKYRSLDGVREDVTRYARTKQAAVQAVREAVADKRHASAGSGDDSLKPSTPFIQAGRVWLKQIERPEAGKSAKTLEAYRGAFARYIDTDGCHLRGLTLAQANDVQRLLALLQRVADEHGSGAAKTLRTVLSGVLGMALRRGVLPVNAALQTGAVKAINPRASARDIRRSLTSDERIQAMEAADALAAQEWADPRSARKWETVADLIAFLAGTGVRISEARLLRWEHVSLSDGAIEIHGTKTLSSVRGLTAPGWLLERLRRRASVGGTEGMVFPAPSLQGPDSTVELASHVPMDSSNLQKWVRKVLNNAGLPWATSHTFRRTVATILHESNAPLVRIADQLGHANPAMTARVYLGRDLRGNKAELAALL
ncbi:site-specific recombinase XerC [Propionicimonas paludicola]|uniref:Site-specific recombinase XerC n=1 Tax=Propionicimonas paludicola TaxID=185243 RepID=A0A2A9CP99_9ACTN|nr:tyrosine-type recombinase/integrase [Propionicimonas paludicola]PFG15976.1 site-specific recombinase XerC [Propionicimonas paludicola]